MGVVVAFSMAAGIFAGAGGGYSIARRLVRKIPPSTGGFIGGSLVALPAFFGSIVIGGNVGGSWGAALGGAAAVPPGIAIGIAVVLASGITAGAVAGALLGALLSFNRAGNAP